MISASGWTGTRDSSGRHERLVVRRPAGVPPTARRPLARWLRLAGRGATPQRPVPLPCRHRWRHRALRARARHRSRPAADRAHARVAVDVRRLPRAHRATHRSRRARRRPRGRVRRRDPVAPGVRVLEPDAARPQLLEGGRPVGAPHGRRSWLRTLRGTRLRPGRAPHVATRTQACRATRRHAHRARHPPNGVLGRPTVGRPHGRGTRRTGRGCTRASAGVGASLRRAHRCAVPFAPHARARVPRLARRPGVMARRAALLGGAIAAATSRRASRSTTSSPR